MVKRVLSTVAVLTLAVAGIAYAAVGPGDRVQIGGRDGTVVSTWDNGDYVVVHLDPTATATATPTATATATATATSTATPPPSGSCDRNATTSTFASTLSAAAGGETICLASGSYSTQTISAQKTSRVTVQPADGATVSLGFTFSSARNITLDAFTGASSLTGGQVRGTSRDLTVSNSRFTGQVVVTGDSLTNANIVFDSNSHRSWNVTANSYEGRFHCTGDSGSPLGVTVRNSFFGQGGESDGIQTGCNGLVIEGNEFTGFVQTTNGAHVDPIQLYGQRNTVIRGNWIHDNQVASSVMAPDGMDHELIENNVMNQPPNTDRRTLNIGGDVGSIVRHNTLVGTIMLKADKNGRASRLGVLKDNIVTEGISVNDGSTIAARGYNLGRGMTGLSEINGMSTFTGGSNPNSFAGYQLTAGSLGKSNASDGLDRGVVYG